MKSRVRRLALWLLAWCDEAPTPDPTADALRHAFSACGLNVAHVTNTRFDVARTGKLNEVLEHAAAHLGTAHPLRTVADLTAFLTR